MDAFTLRQCHVTHKKAYSTIGIVSHFVLVDRMIQYSASVILSLYMSSIDNISTEKVEL